MDMDEDTALDIQIWRNIQTSLKTSTKPQRRSGSQAGRAGQRMLCGNEKKMWWWVTRPHWNLVPQSRQLFPSIWSHYIKTNGWGAERGEREERPEKQKTGNLRIWNKLRGTRQRGSGRGRDGTGGGPALDWKKKSRLNSSIDDYRRFSWTRRRIKTKKKTFSTRSPGKNEKTTTTSIREWRRVLLSVG